MNRKLPSIDELRSRFVSGDLEVRELIDEIYDRVEAPDADPAIWIHRIPRDEALARAAELDALSSDAASLPLFGIPFAVKDNIDVAGMPTTAACPAYAYVPHQTASVVSRLLDAGAVLIGKTNLDQFATGLVGTRSPHGAPRCVFNREFISGGSSSGSAVAVASGMVSFSLGTDTAGSGRVPASFNDSIGLKPTRGRLSTRGVIPACKSLDCVSIFASSVADAQAVLGVADFFDSDDPFSRRAPRNHFERDVADPLSAPSRSGSFRFGVPHRDQWRFFGDSEAAALYDAAIDRLIGNGGEMISIDFRPFGEVSELLYGGPWVAERDAAVGDFIRRQPEAVWPEVRAIISGAARFSATDVFTASYRLQELRRSAEETLQRVDLLALPTAGTIYRVEEVLADPISLNTNLGYYTNFVNLLDLCALAVPAGFRSNGTPFGISLIGPAWQDEALFPIARAYESSYRNG